MWKIARNLHTWHGARNGRRKCDTRHKLNKNAYKNVEPRPNSNRESIVVRNVGVIHTMLRAHCAATTSPPHRVPLKPKHYAYIFVSECLQVCVFSRCLRVISHFLKVTQSFLKMDTQTQGARFLKVCLKACFDTLRNLKV